MGDGSNAFVLWSLQNLVKGAGGSEVWLEVGVVERIRKFVEGVLW